MTGLIRSFSANAITLFGNDFVQMQRHVSEFVEQGKPEIVQSIIPKGQSHDRGTLHILHVDFVVFILPSIA